MTYELTRDDVHAIIVIGNDFETYGGDIVLAITAITHLERNMGAGNFEKCGSLMAKTMSAQAASSRIRPLMNAMIHLEGEFEDEWLAVALDEYYSRINAVDDPLKHINRVLSKANRSLAKIRPKYGEMVWSLSQVMKNALQTGLPKPAAA